MDEPKKLNQNKWTTTSTKIEWEVLEKVKNQKRKAENQKKKKEEEKKHMSNIKDKKKKKKNQRKKKGRNGQRRKNKYGIPFELCTRGHMAFLVILFCSGFSLLFSP